MVLQILGAGLTTDSAYGIVSATYPRLAVRTQFLPSVGVTQLWECIDRFPFVLTVLQGIYPTAVVLAVAAQRSDAHPVITAAESQPIHFATTAEKDEQSTTTEEVSTFDPRSRGLHIDENGTSSRTQYSSI